MAALPIQLDRAKRAALAAQIYAAIREGHRDSEQEFRLRRPLGAMSAAGPYATDLTLGGASVLLG